MMQVRKQLIRSMGILMALGMLLGSMAAEARQGSENGSKGHQVGLSGVIAGLPYEDLSDAEIVGLEQMREEEKLARDVYHTLYEKWGLRIFYNIALSEQQHMTAVKLLLDKYGLPDPITDSTVGVFTSEEMDALYTSLVAKGNASLVDALYVGAAIEDLDLFDLYEFLTETDNADIRTVYQNLAKGSRNHLRAFVYQLSINGATYSAQYLTQEQVDNILSSEMERGRVDAEGNPVTPIKGPGDKAGGGQGSR
ncbi:MAG: DUF2202 domain-containing protein [Deltaproteobacteria bacterium]|nr:DUF2202 domain-containing protein [Deltaproteobacteria bacterium]